MMQFLPAQLKTTQGKKFVMCSNIAITNHYWNAILDLTGYDANASSSYVHKKLVVTGACQEKLILDYLSSTVLHCKHRPIISLQGYQILLIEISVCLQSSKYKRHQFSHKNGRMNCRQEDMEASQQMVSICCRTLEKC
jgi:hypothetical protein